MTGRGEPLLGNEGFLALLEALGGRTDLVWLAGNTIGLGLTLVAAFVLPRYGLFFAYLGVMLRLALYVLAGSRPGGSYFDRMLRLGIVAGFFEIFADFMLVHWLPAGRLIYLTRDAVLLESPLYMPFAWACVILEFGYVPVRLYGLLRRRGARGAALIAGLAGGVVAGASIGLYELFAFRAGWWRYEPAKVMIGPYCAAYIPAGECLMFLGILPIFAAMVRGAGPGEGEVRERAWPAAVVWGIAFAGLIFLSYAAAYLVLG